MINEDFAEGSSWIHNLDPRIKIIVAIMLAVVTAVEKDLSVLLQIFTAVCFILITARLNGKEILKRLLMINIFIFLIWLFLPFTYPGEVLFHFGPLTASYEGVIYTLQITLRSNAIMLIVISLLSTSTITSLIHAMDYLYIPQKLIYLFFFIYRYLYVIRDEFYTLRNAMLLRGFKRETSIRCYKSYAYLMGMLLIRSYERATRVYEAMICRGFNGQFYLMDDFSLSTLDHIVFAGSICLVSWVLV
ncbi:cobalt ECF transporter T component CbiQ [Acetohalobium arabaticum]|uniref:Cobalt ABC transporter, inner membrane subunit CbiQ n=1 Tax=Acetohalobium arabaticum (strain ATCC 49924 / DSM 5501 / Z-7288) TaxID=574087 RepID=D9QVS3_ACEAZ|nr:cobalt ECF transporter T component CbiQ [Acetohalobium arabaticum]ADL12332.1 cobalt ABC transporter, inner membrane subunit CbiQ [Acetohalobium arabaticum DSM 5501]